MKKWQSTKELVVTLCDPNQGHYYSTDAFYLILKQWRERTPILLLEGEHYRIEPISDTDRTPHMVYNIRRIVSLIHAHRFSHNICKTIYVSDRYREVATALANGYKKR